MIGGRHDDRRRWRQFNVNQEHADSAFDIGRIAGVATFFAHRIELVEEHDAGLLLHLVKELAQIGQRVVQAPADEPIIANDVEGEIEVSRQGFGQRGLAIARRPIEQNAIARDSPACSAAAWR